MSLSDWFIEREQSYGGKQRAPRRHVSPHDPRTLAQLAKGSMVGGDRMLLHGYAAAYAEAILELTKQWLRETELQYTGGRQNRVPYRNQSPYDTHPMRGGPDGHRMQPKSARGHDYAPIYARAFNRFGAMQKRNLTLVELGILRGNGLAIWCDLFPDARIIGLDVDLTHFVENESNLRKRGAFKHNYPETYIFDELAPDRDARLLEILGDHKIDIMIDDALHDTESIMKAMATFMPFMTQPALYFVEDNRRVHASIKRAYGNIARIKALGELTVIKI